MQIYGKQQCLKLIGQIYLQLVIFNPYGWECSVKSAWKLGDGGSLYHIRAVTGLPPVQCTLRLLYQDVVEKFNVICGELVLDTEITKRPTLAETTHLAVDPMQTVFLEPLYVAPAKVQDIEVVEHPLPSIEATKVVASEIAVDEPVPVEATHTVFVARPPKIEINCRRHFGWRTQLHFGRQSSTIWSTTVNHVEKKYLNVHFTYILGWSKWWFKISATFTIQIFFRHNSSDALQDLISKGLLIVDNYRPKCCWVATVDHQDPAIIAPEHTLSVDTAGTLVADREPMRVEAIAEPIAEPTNVATVAISATHSTPYVPTVELIGIPVSDKNVLEELRVKMLHLIW